MPVRKIGNKYAVGSGKPVFKTKADAERAQAAIFAKRGGKKKK